MAFFVSKQKNVPLQKKIKNETRYPTNTERLPDTEPKSVRQPSDIFRQRRHHAETRLCRRQTVGVVPYAERQYPPWRTDRDRKSVV